MRRRAGETEGERARPGEKKMQRISQGDQRYYGLKKRSALRDMVCRRGFLIT
jgi:hypothetical protein